jgi:hypothetical protein
MTMGDLIGTIGVALLLLAYFANLRGWLPPDSRAYHGLNVVGAGLAGLASYVIGFWPFVVLEGTWMTVAAIALVRGR